MKSHDKSRVSFLAITCLLSLATTCPAQSVVFTVPQAPRADEFIGRAIEAMEKGQFEEALREVDKAGEVEKDRTTVFQVRGDILAKQGKFRAAIEAYERGLAVDPKDIGVLNSYAWLRATCPAAEVRDGQAAVLLAERIREILPKDHEIHPEVYDTIAACYATDGQFRVAVEIATTAIDSLKRNEYPDSEQLRKEFQGRLALYRQNTAFRLPKVNENE